MEIAGNKPSSRIENTSRNIVSGAINKCVSILLTFINRTVLLQLLGAELTGLSDLFADILQVLNLAELGLHTAIVYSLYDPVAKQDKKAICEKLSILRSVYHIVGLLVFGLGIAIMPFLPRMIKSGYPGEISLQGLFALFLFDSGISYYLFAYKETLLIADQRQDIATNIRTAIVILKNVLQLAILIFTRSFYAYAAVSIAATVTINILINRKVSKHYPYLKSFKEKVKIPSEMRTQISGLLISRISDTCRKSFDGMIISMTLGLVATAIYGNYNNVQFALYGIMLAVCNAMSASIGNSIALRGEKENYENLLDFSMIFSWILGWSAITMACLYQPFMFLWVGKSMMLPIFDMLLFVLYFYVINMNNIRNQYITGTGIWWRLKTSYIVEAVSNLGLNIILGKMLGIKGVILASIITIILFNYLQRNHVLFKTYFKNESIGVFYRQQCAYFAIACIALALTYFLCIRISPNYSIMSIAVRFFICLIIPNAIFLLAYKMCSRWSSAVLFIKRVAAKQLGSSAI